MLLVYAWVCLMIMISQQEPSLKKSNIELRKHFGLPGSCASWKLGSLSVYLQAFWIDVDLSRGHKNSSYVLLQVFGPSLLQVAIIMWVSLFPIDFSCTEKLPCTMQSNTWTKHIASSERYKCPRSVQKAETFEPSGSDEKMTLSSLPGFFFFFASIYFTRMAMAR